MLVLAVSVYTQNQWFHSCAKVYESLAKDVIYLLMEALAIDHKGDTHQPKTWHSVHEFYNERLANMKGKRDCLFESIKGEERLYTKVLEEVIDTMERQLSEVSYFRQSGTEAHQINEDKLQFAPLSNLGTESEFAKLDNRIHVSGGATSDATHSRKNVVKTNIYLASPKFTELDESGRLEQWKWARNSYECEKAREIENNFLLNIQMNKQFSLIKKEELKKKKADRLLKLLDNCKMHNGAFTQKSVDNVDLLTKDQLISEVKYL